MPYELRGKCVYKKGQDAPIKCHETEVEAKTHLRALYANVKDSIHEFSMYISKSSVQDGMMKWSAVNSDTESDLYGEKMTLGLYQKMLSYIKQETPPPTEFKNMVCSDYWCGGMPYLSIAHYPDLNGKAVPGQPLELFIDGTQLKAKGILFDTPLGNAVWKSLKQDEMKQKSGANKERIRISIAFLDLAHKHGDTGEVFERKSLSSICPECAKGVGQKVYVDGYLVHLALTRVPVNPRTIMQAEDIMAKKSKIETRKDDALSIVQDEALVEEISKSALEAKSDVMVEMSDVEVEEVQGGSAVVEEAKSKKDTEDMTAKDIEDADMSDDEEEKDKKKEYKAKSFSTEEVEILRNLIAEAIIPKTVDTVAVPAVTVAPVTQKSALDIATDELYNSVNAAINLQGATVEQRLEAINPALQNLGTSITSLVRDSMGVSSPAPVANDQTMVLEAITSLTNTVKSLTQEIAVLKEKSQTPSAQVQNRIPAPRSIQPVVNQSQVPATPINPMSVRNTVRRSVSSALPLE